MRSSFFDQFEEELKELRQVELEDLKLLRIVAKVDYETGKFGMETVQKISPMLLMVAMLSALFGTLRENPWYPIGFLISMLVLYVPLLIWSYIGHRKSRRGFRKLGLINIVLEEKTGVRWSDK